MPAALIRRSGQEHAEQAAVRNRPAVRDSEPLGARPAAEHPGRPVPDQPGPQAGELLARVAARQHVEHGLKYGPGQPAERRGPPDQGVQVVDAPVVHRGHRDDLLGQHVERVARHPQLFDLAGSHPARDHRRLHQVALVLREDDPPGHIAHVVPGASGALQPARDRGRRLDLDDEIHGAHVDAEFQAGGGDHGRQPAGLQRLLDLSALSAGHRAVVGAGDDLGRALGRVRTCEFGLLGGALGGQFVEPGAQPLGKLARVREHDRGPVPSDRVEHLGLDVRPDRLGPRLPVR